MLEVQLEGRVWNDLDHRPGNSEQEARYWVERLNDPKITVQEAMGLLHNAFTGRRFCSATVARSVLKVAALQGNERSPEGQLAQKAQYALLPGLLRIEGPTGRECRARWWPMVAEDSALMGRIVDFLVKHPGLYRAKTGEGALSGSRDIIGKFLHECWRYYWWRPLSTLGKDNPSETVSERLQRELPGLMAVIKEGGFPSWLQPCAGDELDSDFIRERTGLLLEAQLRLLPVRDDGSPDWDKIVESTDEFSRMVVEHLSRRRVKIRQQIGACRADIEAAEREQGLREQGGVGFAQDLKDRRGALDRLLRRLTEELATIPQF